MSESWRPGFNPGAARMLPREIDDDVEDLPPPLPARPTTPRLCLGGCGRDFPSTGPSHRLCDRCNARNASLSRRDMLRPVRAPSSAGPDPEP
jgi:hypothetical protein